MHDRPRARTEGIVTEYVDDDLVVYDQVSQVAHCLPGEAASVWKRCDGRRSAQEIASEAKLEPVVVEQALSELRRCGLFDDGPAPKPGYSRREAAVKVAKVGGAAFAAPLVYSVAIPSVAAAASCVLNSPGCNVNGASGTGACTAVTGQTGADPRCCSCICYNPVTGGNLCVAADCRRGLAICASNADCCSNRCVLLVCAA